MSNQVKVSVSRRDANASCREMRSEINMRTRPMHFPRFSPTQGHSMRPAVRVAARARRNRKQIKTACMKCFSFVATMATNKTARWRRQRTGWTGVVATSIFACRTTPAESFGVVHLQLGIKGSPRVAVASKNPSRSSASSSGDEESSQYSQQKPKAIIFDLGYRPKSKQEVGSRGSLPLLATQPAAAALRGNGKLVDGMQANNPGVMWVRNPHHPESSIKESL